jgi:hypothetical protein
MKNLFALSILALCTICLTKVSFASGSCTPTNPAYTYIECSATGPGNYTQTYYKNTQSDLFVHVWGYAPAFTDNVYVFAYYPYFMTPKSLSLALYSTPSQQDDYDYVSGVTGTIVLYVESYGSNDIYGGAAAWW